MSTIIVNCRKLPFSSTLGVAHSMVQLTSRLARTHDLVFAMAESELAVLTDTSSGAAIDALADRVISLEQAASERHEFETAIELCPHQFQSPEFCARSVVICYDLHVFDIPWKYGERAEAMQETFRHSLTQANAVVTQFPRTYYAVERAADISLPDLFLTEGPLLLDTSSANDGPENNGRLLYPAQLQEHKNHKALIDAVALIKNDGTTVEIDCPGSDFTAEGTAEILEYAQSAGVAANFNFMGRIDDDKLVDLYRQCKAVVVPSAAEGGAAVVLEAIAAGKPVAANAIDAAKLHADATFAEVHWFDASDVEDTAAALGTMIHADYDEWLRANSDCRRHLAELTWDRVAAKWDAILESIEGERGRPMVSINKNASKIDYV